MAQVAAPNAISLAPHITEILYAAGAGAHLLAVDSASDYPAAALGLPRLGDSIRVNPETLLQRKADSVWAWQASQLSPELQTQLQRLGTALFFMAPETLDDIPRYITQAGVYFGTLEQARAQATQLDAQIHTLAQRYSEQSVLRVFLEVGAEPLYTLGQDPLMLDALHLCGARNLYAHHRLVAPIVHLEDVLAQKPDVVITAYSGAAQQQERQRFWQQRLALPAGAVINLQPDSLFRPGPRLLEAVQDLCIALDAYRQQKTQNPVSNESTPIKK